MFLALFTSLVMNPDTMEMRRMSRKSSWLTIQ
jgi:hypothetical protein